MISNMLRALGDSKTPLYFLVLRRPEFRRRQNEAHPHGRACLHDRARHAACRHRLAVLVHRLHRRLHRQPARVVWGVRAADSVLL